MSTEILTKREIDILKAHDKGMTPQEIAEKLRIPVEEAEAVMKTAQKKRAHLREVAEKRKLPAYIRIVDDRLDETQQGTMKVGSQILKHLSEGIYSSPAGSLKELISNSFDSDATEVDVKISSEEIVVRDNGNGMNWKDFDDDFTFISRSIKGLRLDKTETYKRPVIGFLGIGFISVSELCDELIITSCKKDEEIFFVAEIDFSKYRETEVLEREFYEVSAYKLTNYLKKKHNIKRNKSFTEIKLKKLRPGFKEIIDDTRPFKTRNLQIQHALKYAYETGRGITNLGKYWQMVWELACICPVRYKKDGPVVSTASEVVSNIKADLESYNFKVTLNNEELLKPFKFPLSDEFEQWEYSIHSIRESIKTSDGRLAFRGYVYSQHGIIKPKEYIGIMIRVKNVAIGEIDRALLGYPSGTNQLFRNWVFGEIYIEEGLEDALNINRNRFKVTNPQYIALRDWFHNFLSKVIFKHTLEKYYHEGRDLRYELREEENKQILSDITQSLVGEEYEIRYEKLDRSQPLQIDKNKKLVTINQIFPAYQTSIKIRPIMERTFLILELAIESSIGDMEKLKQIFRENIERWIADIM